MSKKETIDRIQQNALYACAILDCLKELVESECSGETLTLGTSAKSGLAHILKHAADVTSECFELCFDITGKDKELNAPAMFQKGERNEQ